MYNKIDRVNIEGKTFLIEPVMERTVQPGNVSRTVTTDAIATDIENVYSLLDNKKQNKRLEPPLEVCGEEEVFIEEAVKSMADCKNVPEEGSGKFFTTGGAQADKATSFSDQSRKNFLSGMAYKAFGKSQWPRSFLGKVFGPLLGRAWKASGVSAVDDKYNYILDIAYNPVNGVCVAAVQVLSSSNVRIIWSRDGLNWYAGSGIAANEYVSAVTYADGIFVACGTGGIFWSTDGISWTAGINSISGTSIHNIAQTLKPVCGEGKWLVCSGEVLYDSLDGKTWYARVLSYAGIFTTPCYGGRIFVLSNTGGLIWWNARGITSWTQITDSNLSGKYFSRVTYSNGLWLAAAKTGSANAGVWRSTDGKNWTQVSNSVLQTGRVDSITYGDGVWLIRIYSSSSDIGIYRSTDGIGWSKCFDSIGSYLRFANGTWLLVASDINSSLVTIYFSNDGLTWIKSNTSSSIKTLHGEIYGLLYAGGMWYIDPGALIRIELKTGLYYSSFDTIGLKD